MLSIRTEPPQMPQPRSAASHRRHSLPFASSSWREVQKLSLTTTSVRNFVISNASDVIYYEIRTPEWLSAMTTIRRMDPTTRELFVIAEIANDQDTGRHSTQNVPTAQLTHRRTWQGSCRTALACSGCALSGHIACKWSRTRMLAQIIDSRKDDDVRNSRG